MAAELHFIQTSHVYVLVDTPQARVKIGKANAIQDRARQLKVEFDHEASFALRVPSAEAALRAERILHKAFERWRLPAQDDEFGGGNTEWFHTNCLERLRAFVDVSADLLEATVLASSDFAIEQPVPSAKSMSQQTISVIRRNNVLLLFKEFAEDLLAGGQTIRAIDSAFADHLQVSLPTFSMMRSGSRPIGNRLARQIETAVGKPAGWLDEWRNLETPTEAEQVFLDEALAAYRRSTSEGRRQLRKLIKTWAE